MKINEIPTPFFLLDERSLQGELSLLKNALNQYWANYTIGYSVKTNSLPALASILRQKDVSAEVVSEDE
ncbi:MAG: diaminopimelate decarboxylase, partial [Alistipes sp.]